MAYSSTVDDIHVGGAGCDAFATRVLTGNFEGRINQDIDFPNTTGMNPAMVLLVGGAADTAAKPIVGIL